jgi:hypothetical protein
MCKKEKEQVISRDEYFARVEQGICIGNCWVDMGNGEYAYALHEVVAVGVPFNKYGDKFFEIQSINICVEDNTRVDTQRLDAQINNVEKQIAFERRKKDVKERLYKVTEQYFSLKKAQSFPDQQLLKNIQTRESLLFWTIANEKQPLTASAFPYELYAKETQLINEFVKIRSVTANPENSKEEPSEIDFNFYIGTSLTVVSELFYSRDLNTWMGKIFKFYNQAWGGNQYTGGKFKFAENIAKPFKWGSNLLGVYGIISSIRDGVQGKIRPEEAILDTFFGSAALYSGFYGGWANFWYNLGKKYGPATIYLRYKRKKKEQKSVVIEHLKKKGLIE